MTIPQNVADAVKAVRKHFDLSMDDATCEAWCTVRDHLMSQEAEIERLQAGLAKHVDRVCELESRLAAANALLRKIGKMADGTLCDEVRDYLQGAGDEAV